MLYFTKFSGRSHTPTHNAPHQENNNFEITNLILMLIQANCSGMSQKLVVRHQIRFGAGITTCAVELLPWRTPTRCQSARRITTITECPWLIQCYPILYSVPKFLEAYLCIILKILPVYIYICTSILIYFIKRHIPSIFLHQFFLMDKIYLDLI